MELISKYLADHKAAFEIMAQRTDQIRKAAELICAQLKLGKKLIIMGNGGSAADAQHFAAELTGRFENENRKPLPAIALTTDTSAISAISNDFGYEFVFQRQAHALVGSGDVLLGISTSGNSMNVINVFNDEKFKNNIKIALTGDKKSKLSELSDCTVYAASTCTARIQEIHIFVIHCICSILDLEFNDE